MRINKKTGLPFGFKPNSKITFFPDKSLKRNRKQTSATPKWLTKNQKDTIKEIYKLCKQLTMLTGTKHEVDHIVPICGNSVSGLHVPWNLQVITRKQNGSKGNKIIDLQSK